MAMIDATPATPDLNPREARLDLAEADLKQIEVLVPGDTVKVVLTGKVKAISQRENSGDSQGAYGSLDIEIAFLEVTESEDNEIAGLLDEGE
jgi:hypothetical protein